VPKLQNQPEGERFESLEAALNNFGADGWDLVSVAPADSPFAVYTLKREVPKPRGKLKVY
jgi:hypothetical protein